MAPRGRLLPPTVCIDNIDAAVTIDVANSDSMRRGVALFRNVMNRPCARRIVWIGLRVTDITARRVHQFRFAVAIQILQRGNLGLEDGYDEVFLPASQFALRIYIKPNARASSVPAVAVVACRDYISPSVGL